MPTDPIQLQYPVVLIHGLGAKGQYGPVDYFYGLPKMLRDAGNRILIADLTAFHLIEHRARELKEQIERAIPDGKVNLIGHSFGGLDARFLSSNAQFSERVASVTTIGTPNRGSILADVALGLMPDVTFNIADRLLSLIKSSSRAYHQITHRYVNEVFAHQAANSPNVSYFSATSVIRDPVVKTALPVFWIPHRIIKRYEGDNDGFVSAHSASWGEHIATYVGDHYGQIGHFLGYSRGLDYLKFYGEILTKLKARGF